MYLFAFFGDKIREIPFWATLGSAQDVSSPETSTSSHKWEAYRWLQKGLDARRE
jgi:hypothetical protein